jgi:hypothetical protein
LQYPTDRFFALVHYNRGDEVDELYTYARLLKTGIILPSKTDLGNAFAHPYK